MQKEKELLNDLKQVDTMIVVRMLAKFIWKKYEEDKESFDGKIQTEILKVFLTLRRYPVHNFYLKSPLGAYGADLLWQSLESRSEKSTFTKITTDPISDIRNSNFDANAINALSAFKYWSDKERKNSDDLDWKSDKENLDKIFTLLNLPIIVGKHDLKEIFKVLEKVVTNYWIDSPEFPIPFD